MARKDKLIKLLKEYREGKITDDEISKFITFFGEEEARGLICSLNSFLLHGLLWISRHENHLN